MNMNKKQTIKRKNERNLKNMERNNKFKLELIRKDIHEIQNRIRNFFNTDKTEVFLKSKNSTIDFFKNNFNKNLGGINNGYNQFYKK